MRSRSNQTIACTAMETTLRGEVDAGDDISVTKDGLNHFTCKKETIMGLRKRGRGEGGGGRREGIKERPKPIDLLFIYLCQQQST